MRLSRLCCILLALVLLTGAAAAVQLVIEPKTDWLVAGGAPGLVSLTIKDGKADYTITATVPDGLCTVPPPFTVKKKADLSITPGKKSGICQVDITVTDSQGNTVATGQHLQKIDHTTPKDGETKSPPNLMATVGTIVPVSVKITDLHGNNVDNRNLAETVTFRTFGASGFVSGPLASVDTRVQDTTVQVDENGIALVYYYVGEPNEINYVVYSLDPIVPRTIFIDGVLNGVPASLNIRVTPEAATLPWVYADRASRFTATFTVLDTNGFPVQTAQIMGRTEPEGWTFDKFTNENGQASYDYGPFTLPEMHRITAYLAVNPSVQVSAGMETITMDPDHLLATGNPVSMPSKEVSVSPNPHSDITGWVGDPKGNPVKDQEVTFKITKVEANAPLKGVPYLSGAPDGSGTKYPEGSPLKAVTNTDGDAVVYFIPGEFFKSRLDDGKPNPDFNSMAEGTATVEVAWDGQTRTITLTFKRTAYLSLRTSVADTKDGDRAVEEGGTFDVTVDVMGDGSAFVKNPIEVMLVTDRSGSMSSLMQGTDETGTKVWKSRLYWVQQASKAFLTELDPAQDRVGLVSYHTWATRDHELTKDFTGVAATIDQMMTPTANEFVPMKGKVGYTNTRDGIFNATSYLKVYGTKSARVNKAVVLLSDGVWNKGGTPLATGRGYPERSRRVVDDNRYWRCATGSACAENTLMYRTVNWPGSTSFSMYTFYNEELYLDEENQPVMDNPGTERLRFTGEGYDYGTRTIDGYNGYLCDPVVGLYFREGSWSPTMCPPHTSICSNNYGCASMDLYRIDVCDPTYTADRKDCSGTEQNMAVFAKNNDIRIYTITFGYPDSLTTGDPVYGETVKVLRKLAEDTGGKYYNAASADDLKGIYEQIATDLITSASVETGIAADYTTKFTNLDGPAEEWDGSQVFDYVGLKDISSMIRRWDRDANLIGLPEWLNQDKDWKTDKKLIYPIGSIEIGQHWQMKYRMMAKKPGTYNVFGKNSALTWEDPLEPGTMRSLEFPFTPISVYPKGATPINPLLRVWGLHTVDGDGTPSDLIKAYEAFTFRWLLRFMGDPNSKANLKITVTSSDHVYDVTKQYKDEKGPSEEDIPLEFGWEGLPVGTYTVTVNAWGSGNTAEPCSYTFQVVPDPKGPKIILK